MPIKLHETEQFFDTNSPFVTWLGQAGFFISNSTQSIVIDPYLSDSLAKKYEGKKFPHKRMMPIPILPEALPEVDAVFVTHAHTDHMDMETLAPIAAKFPDTPFIVPRSKHMAAIERIPNGQLIDVNAGETHEVADIKVEVFPAAHEKFEIDDAGNHGFLGYGITLGGLRIYHSGDTIPFDGLRAMVEKFDPHILLLPVNGRDEVRASSGVPGNLTLEEAIELSRDFPYLIPHHFGMFDFNTIDVAEIEKAQSQTASTYIQIPKIGKAIKIEV